MQLAVSLLLVMSEPFHELSPSASSPSASLSNSLTSSPSTGGGSDSESYYSSDDDDCEDLRFEENLETFTKDARVLFRSVDLFQSLYLHLQKHGEDALYVQNIPTLRDACQAQLDRKMLEASLFSAASEPRVADILSQFGIELKAENAAKKKKCDESNESVDGSLGSDDGQRNHYVYNEQDVQDFIDDAKRELQEKFEKEQKEREEVREEERERARLARLKEKEEQIVERKKEQKEREEERERERERARLARLKEKEEQIVEKEKEQKERKRVQLKEKEEQRVKEEERERENKKEIADLRLQIAEAAKALKRLKSVSGGARAGDGTVSNSNVELKKREQEVRWNRAIKIMEKRVTSKVFASWISFISIRRRFRKYAKRMAQRKSLAVLKRWIEFVDEKLEMREKVLRAAKKFSFRKLAMGFASWKQHFQLLAQADQAKTDRTRRLKIVLRRLESRLLSKAYTKWVNDQRLEVEVQKVKGEILRSLGAAATKIQCLFRGYYQRRCVLAAAAAAIQEEGESKEINFCDMSNEEVIAAMIKELHDFDEKKLKELGVSDLNLESLLSIHETLQTQCSETSKENVKKHLLLIPEYVQSMFRLKNAALEILAGRLSTAACTLKANAVESKKIDLNNFFELAKNLSTGKNIISQFFLDIIKSF